MMKVLHNHNGSPHLLGHYAAAVLTPPSSSGGNLVLPTEDPAGILFDGPNPRLCVFDLDYTIWPFDCDKDVIAPFTVSPYGSVHDRYGRPSNAFTHVPAIISALVDAGIPIAYASRNPSAGPVEALLRSIAIAPKTQPHIRTLWDALPSRAYFHAYSSAGYGRGKARHFAAIQAASGIAFSDMLFFDDLHDNIVHAQAQGTTSVHLGRKGLTWEAMAAGVLGWRERAARAAEKAGRAPSPAVTEVSDSASVASSASVSGGGGASLGGSASFGGGGAGAMDAP